MKNIFILFFILISASTSAQRIGRLTFKGSSTVTIDTTSLSNRIQATQDSIAALRGDIGTGGGTVSFDSTKVFSAAGFKITGKPAKLTNLDWTVFTGDPVVIGGSSATGITQYELATLEVDTVTPDVTNVSIDFSAVSDNEAYTGNAVYTITDGTGDYGNSIDKSITINISGASGLAVHFSSLDVESGFDFVRFYNSTDLVTPAYNVTGTSQADFTMSNSIKITFYSDSGTVGAGFSFTVTPQ